MRIVTYLVKPGELTLKKGNRKYFEKVLKGNLAAMFRYYIKDEQGKAELPVIIMRKGRIYVECKEDVSEKTERALGDLIGIAGWAKTRSCEKEEEQILNACVEEAKLLYKDGVKTFKIEARRTDKSFNLSSYEIRCKAGSAVKEAIPSLEVNVVKPQSVIEVEIREKAYIYGLTHKGRRGLPVGSAGKGMLLLSGGIDSPVAAYLMACRGLKIEALYFHAWPYTSDEALQKTRKLAEHLAPYNIGLNFHVINFALIQTRIKERSPISWRTVLLRMAMMECAEKLAYRQKCGCLINGESLSQVASQTIENISCTQLNNKLPVLRPLIGMNKEEIISIAESIGTYKISILPYDDLCTLFSPPHPIIRGDPKQAQKLYGELEIEDLLQETLKSTETESMLPKLLNQQL